MSAIRVGKSFFGWTVSIGGQAKDIVDPEECFEKSDAMSAARDLQEYAEELGFGIVPIEIRED